MPAGHNNDGTLVGIEIRASRPRPLQKTQSRLKSKSNRLNNAGRKSRAGGMNGKSRRDIENDIVDDLDNAHGRGLSHNKNHHRSSRGKRHNGKKKSSSSKRSSSSRKPQNKKASKQMMKQTQPDYDPTFDFDNDPEYDDDEYDDDDVDEDEELGTLLTEECAFDQSLANQKTSATRCATAKPYFKKLLYLMVAVALVGYFYDDDMLEDEELDEDITAKQEPYSLQWYKDERMKDDDTQYGGGLIGAEIFGQNETNDEDEDDQEDTNDEDEDDEEEEYHVPDNYFSESFHGHTTKPRGSTISAAKMKMDEKIKQALSRQSGVGGGWRRT